MNQTRFRQIIEDFVSYLYPNLSIEQIDFRDNEYSVLNPDGSISIKGDLSDLTGYKVSRDHQFLPNDRDILNFFIDEVNKIDSYENLREEYKVTLIEMALNRAITYTLSPKSSSTILSVITALQRYADRTYEGKNISLGVFINDVITQDEINKFNNLKFDDFIQDIYSAVLTNGQDSFIEIDTEGYVMRYIQINSELSQMGLSPYEYTKVLEYCGETVIGVVLSEKGELLVFHDNELKYTKRGNHWNPYHHMETINSIHERSENDNYMFARSAYLTALDISFGTSGGIISLLNESKTRDALDHINIHDIVNPLYYEMKIELLKEANDPEYERYKDTDFETFLREEENSKSCVLNRIIDGRKFFQLYRTLRKELVGIDGATVIDYNGEIIAIGAIIKIEAGSKGGGRIAAAKTLSKYGIAIEISSDSSISGYAVNSNDETETIFQIQDYRGN